MGSRPSKAKGDDLGESVWLAPALHIFFRLRAVPIFWGACGFVTCTDPTASKGYLALFANPAKITLSPR